jgi:hypothetical protein
MCWYKSISKFQISFIKIKLQHFQKTKLIETRTNDRKANDKLAIVVLGEPLLDDMTD